MLNFEPNFPQAKANALENEEKITYEQKIKEAQLKVKELVKELDTLNFSDNLEMLNWCMNMQEVDLPDLKVPQEEIVKKFSEHGITPGMNVGRKDLKNDEDAYAKYIIGQAIFGIQKKGYVDQVIDLQIDKWKKEFNK